MKGRGAAIWHKPLPVSKIRVFNSHIVVIVYIVVIILFPNLNSRLS